MLEISTACPQLPPAWSRHLHAQRSLGPDSSTAIDVLRACVAAAVLRRSSEG